MRGAGTRGLDFATVWETVKTQGFVENELTFEMNASIKTLNGAVETLIDFLGMSVVERSDRVQTNAVAHTLLLSGESRTKSMAFAQARLALKVNQVMLNLTVRSQDARVADLIFSSVGES